MTLLRHLLRYGGLYLVATLLYLGICEAAYNGSHHWGWGGVVGVHAVVLLVWWMGYGIANAAKGDRP